MKTTTAIFTAFASMAFAQQTYRIDPSNVSNTTRGIWCTNQKEQCPLICLQYPGSVGAEINTCDSDNLSYQCICTNGQSPNVSEYTQTLPYFICTEWGQECVSNCNGDNLCAADCLQKHPCGAQHPNVGSSSSSSAVATSSRSSSASSAASATASDTVYTGLRGAVSATATSTGAAIALKPMALQFGQAWGLVVVVAGLFGGFAIML